MLEFFYDFFECYMDIWWSTTKVHKFFKLLHYYY
jgi:hypothetical protein